MMNHIRKNIANIAYIAMASIIVGLFYGIFAVTSHIDEQIDEVKDRCPRTEFVVLAGGRNNTPRYVYDCTGVDLKSMKR